MKQKKKIRLKTKFCNQKIQIGLYLRLKKVKLKKKQKTSVTAIPITKLNGNKSKKIPKLFSFNIFMIQFDLIELGTFFLMEFYYSSY